MAVSTKLDKVVVVINSDAFGFASLTTAISFVEEQFKTEADYAKVINRVSTALSDEKDSNFGIYDIASYADLFMDDEDVEDEDEDVIEI